MGHVISNREQIHIKLFDRILCPRYKIAPFFSTYAAIISNPKQKRVYRDFASSLSRIIVAR